MTIETSEVPIYIEETKRGYPDPVDTDTADIELYGEGKGSYILGKDEVFYVGDPEDVVVEGTAERKKIFRWYNGKFVDHLYTNDEDEEQEKYNREPRSTQGYVFTVMRKNVSGSVPLYRHYSSANTDTKLSLNASESGYTQVGRLGYVFTTYNAAMVYANTVIGEVAKPVYSYFNSPAKDSFYTLHPENEVNLEEYSSGGLGPPYPGADNQSPDKGDAYTYTGILCWVFERVSATDTRRIIEVGKPQYAGSEFTYGWLSDVNGGTALGNVPTNWTFGRYSFFGQGFQINDDRANFTFLYGEFGPVKAALPRFLNYKFLYDSQFFYYLYDTSEPWNGPMFGVRMQTDMMSTGNCCIAPPQNGGGAPPCPESDPHIYRYYYQPRANTWKTKRTRIYSDVKNGEGEDQNILTAGTKDKIVFFRYTAGSFNMVEGDTVNGWRITEHRYMGDELTTGFIRISPINEGVDGNDFQYGSVYSTSNTQYPSSFVALSGWGIPDKAAIFGVYEFKKVVGYYRIELHPDAAIPRRTMDEAKIEAIVDNNGSVSGLNIINPGFGYSANARVEIMPPPNENTTSEVTKARTYYLKSEVADTTGSKDTFNWGSTDPDYSTVGTMATSQLKNGVKLKDTAIKIKPAEVKVTQLSQDGCILECQVISGGSGYSKQIKPQVIVYDPKKLDYDESPASKSNPDLNATSKGSKDQLKQMTSKFSSVNLDSSFIDQALTSATEVFDSGVTGSVYTGYIKGVAELDPESTMEMCLGVPGTCVQPLFQVMNPLDYYDSKFFSNILKYDTTGGMKSSFDILDTQGRSAFDNLRITADTASGALGAINKGGIAAPTCLTMGQPLLKYGTRFYDIPCPYTTGSGETLRVYGWMPYQYSASRKESTTFNVFLEVDGDFTGSASSTAQNTALINKLKGLPAPKVLAPRQAAAGVKTWKCTRGSYEGRCFRAGDGDISFYPVGADENVYDYTHLSVYDAYGVWIGQPSSTLTGSSGTGTNGRYYFWLALAGILTGTKYTGPSQPSTSWDYYVYNASSNPNGIFAKYTGYDLDGNGAGNTARWTNYIYTMPPCEGITDIDSVIAIDPTQIAVNDDLIRIGPIKGTVTVKNWSTGSAQVYAQAVQNLGNPYFESCINATI